MSKNILSLIEVLGNHLSPEQFHEMASQPDHNGFTPFLCFVQYYAGWVPPNHSHLRGGNLSL